MINLSDRNKKRLIIGGLAVVCLALVIAISFQFRTVKLEDLVDGTSPSMTSIDVNPMDDATDQTDDSAATSNETKNSADSTGTEQTIQPDTIKSQAPADKPTTQGDTTNPSQTPTYSADDTSVSQPAEPKAGEKKDGKIYVPGFGWIEDQGGGGQGTTVGNPDDELTGNKVGDM